jgi:hypothetical protein
MILLDVTGTGSYAWPQNKAHMPHCPRQLAECTLLLLVTKSTAQLHNAVYPPTT